MNPIIERIGEQPKIWWQKGNDLVNPLVERLNDQSKQLRQKGNDLLVDIQDRQGKLFDKGQKTLSAFEETVLLRATELMEWAYGVTGERSDVLKKSQDFLAERLEELRAEGEELQTTIEPATKVVEPEIKETPVEVADEIIESPFPEYDKLNVKKLAMRLSECNAELLEQARAYETANKGRKTVFETIEKLLSE